MALTVDEARAVILREIRAQWTPRSIESIPLSAAAGRILAEDITADRDYPPFPRSARDGFAIRSHELPGTFEVIGESRAGLPFSGISGPGQAVEIMTGAAMPEGADTIVMVEHVERQGDRIKIERSSRAGDNFTPAGTEVRQGSCVLRHGQRLGYAEIAVLATVGKGTVEVYTQPRVAIIATGDEIVEIGEAPTTAQIRNSNARSLAAQVQRAGGLAEILPVARDNHASTRELIERGLQHDLLLLSGGVSVGKYDIVEAVLAELGAEFFFDRVKIQPGQPLVFGKARGTYFFGLPGNPISTMVTFEIFAKAGLELLAGCPTSTLVFPRAPLTEPFQQKPGLIRFLPAVFNERGLTPIRSQGSGDVFALAHANAFLVTEPDREKWPAGDLIQMMFK